MFKPVNETKYKKPNPTIISNIIGIKASASNLALRSTYPRISIGSQTVLTSCSVKSKIETCNAARWHGLLSFCPLTRYRHFGVRT